MKITNEKPGKADAVVLINGISIFSYNREKDCVDFGFLKGVTQENHPYRIRIFNFGGLFWSSEDFPERYFENSIASIKTSSSKEVEAYHHRGGKEEDAQDYRWILNLKHDLYNGEEIEIKATKPDPIFSKLSIKDAVFYSQIKSATKAKVIISNTEERELRNLGRVVAAGLKCEPNDNIEIGIQWLENARQPITITLLKDQGPFVISVDYKCERTTEEGSDFKYIYDVIIPPNGEVYDLRYQVGEENWGYRSIIGNRQSKKYIQECLINGLEDDFPHALRTFFNRTSEADDAGYSPRNRLTIVSGEYACQSSDSGGDIGVPFPLPFEP